MSLSRPAGPGGGLTKGDATSAQNLERRLADDAQDQPEAQPQDDEHRARRPPVAESVNLVTRHALPSGNAHAFAESGTALAAIPLHVLTRL
jgi:hypothetical protein